MKARALFVANRGRAFSVLQKLSSATPDLPFLAYHVLHSTTTLARTLHSRFGVCGA
jgi:hypothetical protein